MYTGMKFFIDLLGIEYNQLLAAFSFYSGYQGTNIVYPEKWSGSNSATGYLSVLGGSFYQNISGRGFFNGSNIMTLSGQNFTLTNSTLFISYEKLRNKNEILLSSATGNSFNNSVGYCLGVNDANKIYFKYWNPVEGAFTFTYDKILSDKNLILLSRNDSTLTIGRYNNNSCVFETQDFLIYENAFKNNPSGSLYLGGSPNINWSNYNASNFSGYIDKFFFFNNTPLTYSNVLASGLYSLPTGYNGYYTNICYTTGYNIDTGFFSYTGATGVFISGFKSGISGVTGYATGLSGYSYSGITGYVKNSLGIYFDNCGISKEIFEEIGLSGLISGNSIVSFPLTGIEYITGSVEIILTGTITGASGVYITGEVCKNIFTVSGDTLYDIDINYLKSLSYSEISLFYNFNKNNDILEIYNTPYKNEKLNYNVNLINNNLTRSYVNPNNINEQNLLLFLNGQLIVNSGYALIDNNYTQIIQPNIDYYVSGNSIYVNDYNEYMNLFYDSFTGTSNILFSTGYLSGTVIPGINFLNSLVFYNGQKLISGVDYTGSNTLNFSIESGNNYFIIKNIYNIIYKSGNNNTMILDFKDMNNDCSQVYLNGIKQKLNNNYIENSIFDFISGDYYEPQIKSIIYNNTDDFFV